MKEETIYHFITILIFGIVIELIVAITNQFYVPIDKKYHELTPIQKILYNTRFILNTIESLAIIYVLIYYNKYLNTLTIILFLSILIACIRYYLFRIELIYYFVDKTEKNKIIIDFMEGPFGKIQNFFIVILLIIIIIKIYLH